jgi:hypothetical protein
VDLENLAGTINDTYVTFDENKLEQIINESTMKAEETHMTNENVEQHWIDHFEFFIPLSKAKYEPREDLIPSSMLIAQQINNNASSRLLRVLFDSGGTTSMINERVLTKGCVPTLLKKPVLSKTIWDHCNQNDSFK